MRETWSREQHRAYAGSLCADEIKRLLDPSEYVEYKLEQCERAVGAYLWRLLGNTADVDEGWSRTRVVALQRLGPDKTATSYLSWLCGIARRASFEIMRETGRQPPTRDVPDEELEAQPDTGARDPADEAVSAQALKAMASAIMRLPDLDQRMLRDKIKGLTYKEIATAHRTTVSTVAYVLRRARREVDRAVGHSAGEEG